MKYNFEKNEWEDYHVDIPLGDCIKKIWISRYQSLTFVPNNNNSSFLYILNNDNHSAILQQIDCRDGTLKNYPLHEHIDFDTNCIINSQHAFLENSRYMYFNSTLLTLDAELHIIQSYTKLSMYHLKWDNSMKQMKILFNLGDVPILCAIKPDKNKIWIICAQISTPCVLYVKEYSIQSKKWIPKATFSNIGAEFNYVMWHKNQVKFVSVYNGNFLLAFNYLRVNTKNQGIYIFDVLKKQKHRSSITLPRKLDNIEETHYVSSIVNLNRDNKIVMGYIKQFEMVISTQIRIMKIPLHLCSFISKWYQNEYIQMTITTQFNKTIQSFAINVDTIIQNLL